MKTNLLLEVDYDPRSTDPEGLACAVDQLLGTALSTPGILDECGNPQFGSCCVAGTDISGRSEQQGRSNRTASRLVLANELPREVLVEIVATAQSQLYLDMDGSGREFWNPAKDCSGWDVCQAIQEVMSRHGLVPEEEQECVQIAKASPALDTGDLVTWARSQGLAPEDLDDEVHDLVGTLASSLNNRGLSAQIEFLVQQFGNAETQGLLAKLVADKAEQGAPP